MRNLRFSITSSQDTELWKKPQITVTFMMYVSNRKIRRQVLLCFFQMLPIFGTLQKAHLLSYLHYSQLATYSQMASRMAELHESRNVGALRAPTLLRHLCSRIHTGAGPAGALQKKQFPWLVCGGMSVSLSPLPWTACPIGHELTQKRFSSVSPLYLAPKKPCSLTTINTFSWYIWLIWAHGFKSSQREGWRYKQSMIA